MTHGRSCGTNDSDDDSDDETLGDINHVNITPGESVQLTASFHLTDIVTFTFDLDDGRVVPSEVDLNDTVVSNARLNQIIELRETARQWLADHGYEIDNE